MRTGGATAKFVLSTGMASLPATRVANTVEASVT